MKKLMFAALAALIASATALAAPKQAATPPPGEPRKSMPLAERKALAQRRILERTGGYVVKQGAHGKVVFVNGQDKVPVDVIEKQTKLLSELLSVVIEIAPGKPTFAFGDVPVKREELKAPALIFFVDDPALAETMLVAPESGWALVNFAALANDGAAQATLNKRAVRETWRSFAMLLGAADSNEPKCIMRPVNKLRDLDAMYAESFCPEPLDKIVSHLKAMGIDASQRVTYRQACEEGWAPAPTNEFQKAIWERIKAEHAETPANPLLIKPGDKPAK